jgi:hypothetical protein
MPVAVLFARVTKIKIIDYLGEVVVTLEPKCLPLPRFANCMPAAALPIRRFIWQCVSARVVKER